jgi:hypothetical protein
MPSPPIDPIDVSMVSPPQPRTTITAKTYGIWTVVNPANTPQLNGVNTKKIQWGQPANDAGYPIQGPQSGYLFEGVDSSNIPLDGTDFLLGTFTHFNFVIQPPSITSATLKLTIEIEGGLQKEFTFVFNHNETPNPGVGGSCPQTPGYSPPCPDIVSIPSLQSTEKITIDGKEYVVTITGFLQNNQKVNQFITIEKQENSAQLYGKLEEVKVETPEKPKPPEEELVICPYNCTWQWGWMIIPQIFPCASMEWMIEQYQTNIPQRVICPPPDPNVVVCPPPEPPPPPTVTVYPPPPPPTTIYPPPPPPPTTIYPPPPPPPTTIYPPPPPPPTTIYPPPPPPPTTIYPPPPPPPTTIYPPPPPPPTTIYPPPPPPPTTIYPPPPPPPTTIYPPPPPTVTYPQAPNWGYSSYTGYGSSMSLSISCAGVWSNVVEQVPGACNLAGIGTNQITWGVPYGSIYQSGYRFDGISGINAVLGGSYFYIGTFTHYNFPIIYSITSVLLSLSFTINGTQSRFSFTLTHQETPNEGAAGTPDIVTLVSTRSQETITINSRQYALQLGFYQNERMVEQLITVENQVNTVYMVALFVEVQSSTQFVVGGPQMVAG